MYITGKGKLGRPQTVYMLGQGVDLAMPVCVKSQMSAIIEASYQSWFEGSCLPYISNGNF